MATDKKCRLFAYMSSLTSGAQDRDAMWIMVGGADLIPALRLDCLSNSNACLTQTDEVTATGVRIAPSLTLRADRRLLALDFGYYGDYTNYSEDALGLFRTSCGSITRMTESGTKATEVELDGSDESLCVSEPA